MVLRVFCRLVLVGMTVLFLALPAAAESPSRDTAAGAAGNVVLEPQPLTGAGTGDSAVEAAGAGEKRDPFATTEYLENQKISPEPDKRTFRVMDTPGRLPKMKLKGHLQGADKETLALLEIEGGEVHLVREGDTVGLHDLGFSGAIRIRKIDRLHLVIEAGSYGQLIIVR